MKMFLRSLGVSLAILSSGIAPAATSPVLGGYIAVDTFQPEVVGAAHFAVFTLNQEATSPVYKLETIISAESQIVAGVNYRLTLLLSSQAGEQIKEVVVFHQAWTHTWQLLSVKDI